MGYVCMCATAFESLLFLNALTDLHQICSESQPTQSLEIDGGVEANPLPVGVAAAHKGAASAAHPAGR